MPQAPLHPSVIPLLERLLESDPLKEPALGEMILTFVPPIVEDGYDGDGDHVGGQQDYRHGNGLVVEHRPGDAAEEDEGYKHGAGREDGAQHRSHDLAGTFQDSLPEIAVTLPTTGYVIHEYYRVVSHHSHSEKQSGQGDDVEGEADRMEAEHGEHQGHGHGQRHQCRGAEVPHEEENHHAGQQERHDDVLKEIAD